jgi:hypothetical protein
LAALKQVQRLHAVLVVGLEAVFEVNPARAHVSGARPPEAADAPPRRAASEASVGAHPFASILKSTVSDAWVSAVNSR